VDPIAENERPPARSVCTETPIFAVRHECRLCDGELFGGM
jgi:hypothetical protein